MSELFYPLTYGELVEWASEYQLNLSQLKLMLYFCTKNPFGDREVELDFEEATRDLNMGRATIYRELKTLDKLGLAIFTRSRHRVNLRFRQQKLVSIADQNPDQEMRQFSQKRDADQNPDQGMRQFSQKRENNSSNASNESQKLDIESQKLDIESQKLDIESQKRENRRLKRPASKGSGSPQTLKTLNTNHTLLKEREAEFEEKPRTEESEPSYQVPIDYQRGSVKELTQSSLTSVQDLLPAPPVEVVTNPSSVNRYDQAFLSKGFSYPLLRNYPDCCIYEPKQWPETRGWCPELIEWLLKEWLPGRGNLSDRSPQLGDATHWCMARAKSEDKIDELLDKWQTAIEWHRERELRRQESAAAIAVPVDDFGVAESVAAYQLYRPDVGPEVDKHETLTGLIKTAIRSNRGFAGLSQAAHGVAKQLGVDLTQLYIEVCCELGVAASLEVA